MQGLAGSDLKAALAGAAAPYVAEIIGHYSNLDDAGKVAAHAVVNAALAAAQNQSALAGAAGAATAEIVGLIATQMYGKPASELDETQKQTVSTLATLPAGLAGTVGWNAAGGAFGNWLDGKDPLSGAAMSGGTSAIGYGVGKVIQGPLEKVIDPNWKNWEWTDVGMGSASLCHQTQRLELLEI